MEEFVPRRTVRADSEDEAAERLVQMKTVEIQTALGHLAREIAQGNDKELLHWVIDDELAVGHRPLRYHPYYGASGKNVAPEAAPLVKEWVELIQCAGIRSIILLMHERDLWYYEKLDLGSRGLIDFYTRQGFEVAHLPWEDPFHKRTPRDQLRQKVLLIRKEALQAYGRLKKPIMVQCSAGIDRTAPVAAYIFHKTIQS
jgi:hypothetical protein